MKSRNPILMNCPELAFAGKKVICKCYVCSEWVRFPQTQLSFVWQKNRSFGSRVARRNRGHVVHSNASNALQWAERAWRYDIGLVGKQHMSTSVQVANCLFLGSGWAVSWAGWLFSAPGLTAMHCTFYLLRAIDRTGTESNWWKGGEEHARKGKGRWNKTQFGWWRD